jgi:hypothetical protein
MLVISPNCLRLIKVKLALAHWIGNVETQTGQMKTVRLIDRCHGTPAVE